MRKIALPLLVLASTALGACGEQENEQLNRMVQQACDDLHAAWNQGDREAMDQVLAQLRERAVTQGFSPEEAGSAFEQQCTMPG